MITKLSSSINSFNEINKMDRIPFNKPYMTGKELWYISEAHHAGQLAGDGSFTKKSHLWLEAKTGSLKALLTPSCTASLEMAAILADLEPGDEVIMPSYTFVSTANAFVLRGAIPVFIDIRSDTLNLDETLVESAITARTRAIVPVHYAGVGCEMDTLQEIAKKHQLLLIEDAAQGVMSSYKGKALGSIGDLGCFSFHETKNVISGEGGALLINIPKFAQRAEIIREKGTNRSQFFRGEVDKYTWIDRGSSYLPGEIIAAFLYAQLEEAERITASRMRIWQEYHSLLEPLEKTAKLRRPIIPYHCQHNAHMYYILVENLSIRTELIRYLKDKGINTVFHYVPLHSSLAGIKYGRTHSDMNRTNLLSDCIIRLPIWVGFADVLTVVNAISSFFKVNRF
jgi:dTDP-4-amino-4,6-dideoxygalactose transaminase